MKERALIQLTLVTAIVAGLLMVFVADQNSKARQSLYRYSISVFHFTNQNANNLSHFNFELVAYRHAEDSESRAIAKKRYLQRFDVLWSSFISLHHYRSQQDFNNSVQRLMTSGQDYIQSLDAVMQPDHELSNQDVDDIYAKTMKLLSLNSATNNAHYIRFSQLSDDVDARLSRSLWTYKVLGVMLGISILCFVGLIWRVRRNEQRSTRQLRTAHEQLTRVVEELRSGNAERTAMNQFIAAASHDLRQPLHALGLFLNSLEKNVHEPEGKRLLYKIRQSTSALNGLFNGLLDISRLDAGVVEINREHFLLNECLRELREEFSGSDVERTINIMGEVTNAVVYSDRVLLQRILRNLLENAVNHAPSSTVRLDVTITQDQIVRIVLSDNGPGIPNTEHKLIFSEYYQMNNPERDRNKGLGLGLSIVKRLSDLLEMDMRFESVPGVGTSFALNVPIGELALVVDTGRADATLEHDFTISGGSKGLQVLVIDDEQDIRDGMEIILAHANCKVISAESAEQARLKIVAQNIVPDIIIADYRLRHHQTGSDAVLSIREELNQAVPAMIVTGDTSPERLREATLSGMRLLHKPVVPAELFRTIKEILGDYSLAEHLPEEEDAEAVV